MAELGGRGDDAVAVLRQAQRRQVPRRGRARAVSGHVVDGRRQPRLPPALPVAADAADDGRAVGARPDDVVEVEVVVGRAPLDLRAELRVPGRRRPPVHDREAVLALLLEVVDDDLRHVARRHVGGALAARPRRADVSARRRDGAGVEEAVRRARAADDPPPDVVGRPRPLDRRGAPPRRDDPDRRPEDDEQRRELDAALQQGLLGHGALWCAEPFSYGSIQRDITAI
mmetsp:Transcript_23192/g.60374  ORF Transcript_23192/g.60374 Transcript_23192/m.60374 type:complete len:228 (-) Transcript_23192:59-742(-)